MSRCLQIGMATEAAVNAEEAEALGMQGVVMGDELEKLIAAREAAHGVPPGTYRDCWWLRMRLKDAPPNHMGRG